MYIYTIDDILEAIQKKCNYKSKPLDTYAMISITSAMDDRSKFLAINIINGWVVDGNRYGYGSYYPWIHNTSMISSRDSLGSEIFYTILGSNIEDFSERFDELVNIANKANKDMVIDIQTAYRSRGRMNPRMIGYKRIIMIPADAMSYKDIKITDHIVENKADVMKIISNNNTTLNILENKMNNKERRFDFHVTY